MQLYLNYTLISEELAFYLSAVACFPACSSPGLCAFFQVCKNVIYKSFHQFHVVYPYGFIVLFPGAVNVMLVPLQPLSACSVNKKLFSLHFHHIRSPYQLLSSLKGRPSLSLLTVGFCASWAQDNFFVQRTEGQHFLCLPPYFHLLSYCSSRTFKERFSNNGHAHLVLDRNAFSDL